MKPYEKYKKWSRTYHCFACRVRVKHSRTTSGYEIDNSYDVDEINEIIYEAERSAPRSLVPLLYSIGGAYRELFETWESGPINPSWFLQEYLIPLYIHCMKAVHFEMRFDEFFSFLISYILPRNPSPPEVCNATNHDDFSRYYDFYYLDAFVGGGWLPPYDTSTQISPYKEWIPSIKPPARYFTEFGSYKRYPAFEYDYRIGDFVNKEKEKQQNEPMPLCCFSLVLSEKDSITPQQMESFWTSLQGISYPVIFEIVGNGDTQTVGFQFLCPAVGKAQIGRQLSALFPNSTINLNGDDDDLLKQNFLSEESGETALSKVGASGLSLGLGRHYEYSLRTLTRFDVIDPLSSVINLLGELPTDEVAVVQVLVSPLNNWSEHLDRCRKHRKPLDEKMGFPLFAACFRVVSFDKKGTFSRAKCRMLPIAIESALVAGKLPDSN